jgi:N-succinyldiaminopimelate aminotransferase
VRLTPPHWRLDGDALAAAFGPATKAIILNDPMNPAAKVFSPDELALIAALCVEHDAYAICDEVYEHLTFDGRRHVPLATLPGMAERTVTISSAGKTFSVTGWKIGWACGPAPLVSAVRAAKQFLTYVGGAPFQPAVAHALREESAWVADLRESLQRKRDRLCEGLRAAGFGVSVPAGTYFVQADLRPLGETDGMAFCKALPGRARVVAVPTQVFYDDPADATHLVRFAFCKADEVIDEAARRLARLGR